MELEITVLIYSPYKSEDTGDTYRLIEAKSETTFKELISMNNKNASILRNLFPNETLIFGYMNFGKLVTDGTILGLTINQLKADPEHLESLITR